MSGGSHDYAYSKLNDIADSFHMEREEDGHEDERKKTAEILRLMSKVCYIIEWIDSADYGESDWKEVEELLGKIEIKI